MYQITYTSKFKRDYKLVIKRGYKEALIQSVVTSIANKKALAAKHNVHKLTGDYKDCLECHILPDWLLIWRINEAEKTLTLIRTGTHSDLF